MKYFKYNLVILTTLLFSCNLLNDETDYENFYSCSMYTEIINSSKGINPCTFIINYNNTSQFYKTGYFQITLKNSKSSFTINSKIVTLNEGRNTITIAIDDCSFQGQIQKTCFMTK